MAAAFDVLIENGRVFDGLDNPSRIANVGIRDGKVVTITDERIPHEAADEVLDAEGLWVMPGFIDFHTHCPFNFISFRSWRSFLFCNL